MKRPLRHNSKVDKFGGLLRHEEGHHMTGNHQKGHHARCCVYVSIVEQNNNGNNNSNPQVHDDEKI